MKKLVFFALLLALLLTAFAVAVSAEVITGQAVDAEWIRENEGTGTFQGSDISTVAPNYRIWYSLDTDTGVMRIYHKDTQYKTEQEMLPYAKVEWIPWLKTEEPNVQRPYILEVHIEEDVLRVGQYSFYECENLHSVYLPSSIYKIDKYTFYGCESLEAIYYAGTEEDFRKYVHFDEFHNDEALGKFVFGESVTVLVKNQHGEVLDEYIVGGYAAGDAYSFLPKEYDGLTYTGDPTKPITGVFAENDQTVYELIYNCNHNYQPISESTPCISRCSICKHNNPNSTHVFNDEGTIPCKGVCRICNVSYDNENGFHDFDFDYNADDPTANPCRYYCAQCAQTFENEQGQHDIVEVNEAGSLFQGKQTGWKCTICGQNELRVGNSVMFYVGIVGLCVAGGVVIFLAIFLPIRRKKRIKDMTW